MGRFIEAADRTQTTLLPEAIDDYVGAHNPVRVVDAFVDALDLAALGFDGVIPEETGRPSYHPATILKIYVYGYLPGAVIAWPRARVPAEPRAHLADGPLGTGLQDDRRFPP